MLFKHSNGKCQFISIIATALFLLFCIEVCESREQRAIRSSPFFKIESTASAGVWVDPQFGVWFYRTGSWGSDRRTMKESRKAIEEVWPNAGFIDWNLSPFLRDRNGGLWFFSGSGRRSGLCYAHFDGQKWTQPHLPDASLSAPPRVQNSGGPRYHNKGIIDPAGNPIFFEDLGALIWKNNGWVYGSFYDFQTYPQARRQKDGQGWPAPIYLRTKPRSAVSSRGIVWLWGFPESDNYKHVPSDLKRILKWDGTTLTSEKAFRGIRAGQIQDICFLSNGDAWVWAHFSGNEWWNTWPVLTSQTADSKPQRPVQLQAESGEIVKNSRENNAVLLFQDNEHIYTSIGNRIFRLLPNGTCREMSEYPWDTIKGYLGVSEGSHYKAGPHNLWFTVSSEKLYHWDGKSLSMYDPGMGSDRTYIVGVAPNGRIYMNCPENVIFSLDPLGQHNAPILTVTSASPASSASSTFFSSPLFLPLRLDDQGRMCAYDGGRRSGYDLLWPPTERYESNKWRQLCEPEKPSLPPWRSIVPRPPVNALEKADSQEFVTENFDEICELLSKADAPFYRTKLRPLGNKRILWLGGNGVLNIYDGREWTDLTELMGLDQDTMLVLKSNMSAFSLSLLGTEEFWFAGCDKWYCIALPCTNTESIYIKHVISKIDPLSRLGIENKDRIWDLSSFGPRFICEIQPERLVVKDRNSKLCGVDRKGRTYIVTAYKGLLVVSDGVKTWSCFHDAMVSPNQNVQFDFDGRGRIWCSSSMGLLVWDNPSEVSEEIKLLHFEPRQLQFPGQLCFDVYGNLWLTGKRLIRDAGKIEFVNSK